VPIREFTDAHDVHWRVWATTPTRGDVRPQFAAGWLTFESLAERRRLAPIPSSWSESGDDDLYGFLASAVVVTRTAASLLQPIRTPPSPPPAEQKTLDGIVARVRAVIDEVDKTLQRGAG
jgi:hypothetical protein